MLQLSLVGTVPGAFSAATPPEPDKIVIKLASGERVRLLAEPRGKRSQTACERMCERIKLLEPPKNGALRPRNPAKAAPEGSPHPSTDTAVSPAALVSFSPDALQAERHSAVASTVAELVQSEYVYVKSLELLAKFFLEPLVVRCAWLRLTCTPLLHMGQMVDALRARHEAFLGEASRGSEALVAGIAAVLAEPAYGEYPTGAELLRALVQHQVPPFELLYVRSLQGFLEQSQPGDWRMDLSLVLLMQKPMGRIAKYRLFLQALARVEPDNARVLDAVAPVSRKLALINDAIAENDSRLRALREYGASLNYARLGVHHIEYFGCIRHVGRCAVLWMAADRRGAMAVSSRVARVAVHDRHVVVADNAALSVLFVVPQPNCRFVADCASSDGGLYSDDRMTCKLVFAVGHSMYEVMLVTKSEEAHASLAASLQPFAGTLVAYAQTSDGDAFVGPDVARYDLDLADQQEFQRWKHSCYFREVYQVSEAVQTLKLRGMGTLLRKKR